MHRLFIWTARILADQGLVVIVDAATPQRAQRDEARGLILAFAEVQLIRPGDGAVSHLASGAGPDICLGYEESPTAELTLNTHVVGCSSAVGQVVALVRRLLA